MMPSSCAFWTAIGSLSHQPRCAPESVAALTTSAMSNKLCDTASGPYRRALFSLTGRSGVRNSIPMLARMQRASEYLHKGMDQPPTDVWIISRCCLLMRDLSASRASRGRMCEEFGCSTILSTYNSSSTCWLHTGPAHRHPLARS